MPRQTLRWSEAIGTWSTQGSAGSPGLEKRVAGPGGEEAVLEAMVEPSPKDPPPTLKPETQPPEKLQRTVLSWLMRVTPLLAKRSLTAPLCLRK